MDDTNEILQRITRLETKIDLLVTSKDIATEALSSAKEASRRLDKIERIIFWSGTTVVGLFIAGLVTLLIKQGA